MRELQDLAKLDALLSNWDMILTKMGPASAALEQDLRKDRGAPISRKFAG